MSTSNTFAVVNKQPKRYTMADIGNLERRLQGVEYAVQLSLVESQVKDLAIPSSVTPSVNRFKNGYFVDGFDDTTRADTNQREYRASIDSRASVLKPAFTQFNVESEFDTANTTTMGDVVNSSLLLPFAEEKLLSQDIKNITIGVDAQDISFIGSGTVTPPSFSIKARGETVPAQPDPVDTSYTYHIDGPI